MTARVSRGSHSPTSPACGWRTSRKWLSPDEWCSRHGVDVLGGLAVVYKLTREDGTSVHHGPCGRLAYPVGSWVEAPDWQDDYRPGHGLHVYPTVHEELVVPPSWQDVPLVRLALLVDLRDLRPIVLDEEPPQAKARAVLVVSEVAA